MGASELVAVVLWRDPLFKNDGKIRKSHGDKCNLAGTSAIFRNRMTYCTKSLYQTQTHAIYLEYGRRCLRSVEASLENHMMGMQIALPS